MFKYTFFLLLITAIFAKKVTTTDDIVLKASIAEAEPLAKDVAALVEAIKAQDAEKAIEVVYTLVSDGNSVFWDCVKLVP